MTNAISIYSMRLLFYFWQRDKKYIYKYMPVSMVKHTQNQAHAVETRIHVVTHLGNFGNQWSSAMKSASCGGILLDFITDNTFSCAHKKDNFVYCCSELSQMTYWQHHHIKKNKHAMPAIGNISYISEECQREYHWPIIHLPNMTTQPTPQNIYWQMLPLKPVGNKHFYNILHSKGRQRLTWRGTLYTVAVCIPGTPLSYSNKLYKVTFST